MNHYWIIILLYHHVKYCELHRNVERHKTCYYSPLLCPMLLVNSHHGNINLICFFRAGPTVSLADEWQHMAAAHAPLTWIYRPYTHMLLWHTKSSDRASAYVRYWMLRVIRAVCVCACVCACVRYIHGMAYAQKIHVSASVACEWHMSTLRLLWLHARFSLHLCVHLYLCVCMCVHACEFVYWAQACVVVIRIGQLCSFVFSPKALGLSHWLGIRDGGREKERENSSEWGNRDQFCQNWVHTPGAKELGWPGESEEGERAEEGVCEGVGGERGGCSAAIYIILFWT